MSAEVTKPVEPTPAAVSGSSSNPLASTAPTAATTTIAEPNAGVDTITSATETTPDASTEKTNVGEAKAEVSPASEGVLGYQSPGIIQTLRISRFSKRFFWFSDEALKTDTLDSYLRSERAEIAHPTAAWAHETGKGLLFFAKRAEDKAAPTGILNLADISDVTKEGSNDFSFKINGHKHVFQASSTSERSSWIAAIETNTARAKELKDSIVGSEGYKKHFERYNNLGAGTASSGASLPTLSKSRDRKETSAPARKSLEIKTKLKGSMKKDKADASSASSSDAEKTDKSKGRSQSRKRNSIFALLGNKKEEDGKKDEKVDKAEEKAEKKHDEEVAIKAQKLDKENATEVEKEVKQAESTASHPPVNVAEVGAAAPGHVAPTEEKKADESRPELSTDRKGGKRSSFFGGFFGGRKDVTSPSVEKAGDEVSPVAPTKANEVAPVHESAPQIDEPLKNKPIDTAAVIAPADSAITANDHPANGVHAQTTTSSPPSKSPSTPSHKGGVMGFFKRQDSRLEKEAKTDESITSPNASETVATSEAPVAPVSEGPKPKRRTSIFNSLGTKKEKKTGEPNSEAENTEGEVKKSPLPQKLGGLFRKPSKAVTSEDTPSEPTSAGNEPASVTKTTVDEAASPAKTGPVLTNGTNEGSRQAVNQVSNPVISSTQEVKTSA